MIKLKSPNQWSCLATSFAMLFNITVEKLYQMIGHDGSEKWWPELDEPLCRRGHHLQELTDVGEMLGYIVMYIEAKPQLQHPIANDFKIIKSKLSTEYYMGKYNGVVLGINEYRHAVAFDHNNRVIYDPNGQVYEFKNSKLIIEAFCPVLKILG
jgi:hypothetical protein